VRNPDELQAIVTESEDLYVWRSRDVTHCEFAALNYLRPKVWLCIDTRRNLES
jgi:hypothetical protein